MPKLAVKQDRFKGGMPIRVHVVDLWNRLVSKAGIVKATVDAVSRDAVFKPVRRPDLSEGERVRITVERVGQAKPDDIPCLAAHVYEGLSPEDIGEIEETARHRTLFGDAHLLMAQPKALLDTDILSVVISGNPAVTARAAPIWPSTPALAFSIITRYEILRGLQAKHATTQLQAFGRFCDLAVRRPDSLPGAVPGHAL